jgi:hypothetical protein
MDVNHLMVCGTRKRPSSLRPAQLNLELQLSLNRESLPPERWLIGSARSADFFEPIPNFEILSCAGPANPRKRVAIGLQRKSAVYGLNGRRAHSVMALSVGTCEHTI